MYVLAFCTALEETRRVLPESAVDASLTSLASSLPDLTLMFSNGPMLSAVIGKRSLTVSSIGGIDGQS